MQKIFWFTNLLFISPLAVLGEPPSLFFTDKEINLIKQIFIFQQKLEKNPIKPENLYLSAILYVDETHWTLWANQKVVHASDLHFIDGYSIEKVTPLSAVFSYKPPSSLPKKFTLRVHHMFLSAEIKIIKINE